MEETLQLFSFFLSFLFGFFFHFFSFFHFKICDKYSIYFRYFVTFLFVLDSVLIYLLLLYYLNGGVLHIYFLIFVFLGFFSYGYLSKHVNFSKILSSRIVKFFRK